MKSLSKDGIVFVRGRHFATLTTLHGDGSPHTTPIWYMYEDGKFIVNTSEGRVKLKNIRRDGRVVLVVHDEYSYISLEGEARVALERDPLKDIESLAVRYQGRTEGEKAARDRYWKQKRVSIELTPKRVIEQLG